MTFVVKPRLHLWNHSKMLWINQTDLKASFKSKIGNKILYLLAHAHTPGTTSSSRSRFGTATARYPGRLIGPANVSGAADSTAGRRRLLPAAPAAAAYASHATSSPDTGLVSAKK